MNKSFNLLTGLEAVVSIALREVRKAATFDSNLVVGGVNNLIIEIMVTLPILATNPITKLETYPKSDRYPVVYSVHCALQFPAGTSYPNSCLAYELDIGSLFDYQIGANDYLYWWRNHDGKYASG